MTRGSDLARLEERFLAAMEQPAPDRESWARSACGDDPELLKSLLQLLETERCSVDPTAGLESIRLLLDEAVVEVPEEIGPYRIVRLLGEGGWGIVFEAEQAAPIQRRVAVKVLRPGIGSSAMVRRFRRELDVLSRMEHPGIAKVFDAGITSGNQPYFVMELVEGTPIDVYCREHALRIEERLRLIAEVCDAVQHAHAKSVVHRDLKPANVLVVETDGSVRPVVIDFGIAKALDDPARPDLTTAGALTALGTPAYMSPEQTIPAGRDIDTRTDVYSLGVILFQLVTGVTPFTIERAKREAGGDLLRLIRESEPPRPLSLPSDGALGGRLPRELDWIILRCLAKRPAERYQTAAELGEELRRLLRGEPVAVGPPSAWYRTTRLLRRHPLVSTLMGALLLAIVVGGSLASVGFVQAEQARRAEGRRLAESEAVANFLQDVLTGIDAGEAAGAERAALVGLVDRAADKLDGSSGFTPEIELRLHRTLRGAYTALGEPERCVEHSRRIVLLVAELHGIRSGEVAKERLQLWSWYVYLAMLDDLLAEGEEQISAAELVAGKTSDLAFDSRRYVALALEQRSRFEEAEEAYRLLIADRRTARGPEDPDLLQDLGNLSVLLGRTGRGDEAFELQLGIYEAQLRTLPPSDFPTTRSRLNLASLYNDRGEHEFAVAEARAVIGIWREQRGVDDRWTMWAFHILAQIYHTNGSSDDAIAVLSEAVDALSARRDSGRSTEWARDIVPRLATLLRERGDGGEAASLLQEWGLPDPAE